MSNQTREANADQIEFWNSIAGPRWVRRQQMLDRQLEEIGAAAIDAANISTGDAVVDVGCGCGDSTLALAARVGEHGRVVGLDVSAPMLDLARERARRAGAANVEFTCDDAQVHAFVGDFDVVFSRFGVMFFDDPVVAFGNLRSALRDGGRLAFVCWQALPKNPWMSVPLMAVLRHITIQMPASPEAPGPFALADAARLEKILAQAGFRDIALRGLDTDLLVAGGGDLDEAVGFVLELGPVERALGEAPPAVREAVRLEVREALAAHAGSGGVRMPSSAWIVTATK